MKLIKKEIYSQLENSLLLHIICKAVEDDEQGRKEIIPENNFLQCSYLQLPYGKTFRPHKHIKKERHYKKQIAQESWVVVKGKVKCIFYDIDDKIIHTDILGPGDASFTLEGGHNYEILEHDTLVYEYKTGPYEGQKLDKVFLDV
tara:strand:+ start:609 stop:1043 length:435 start_codon:yes stop_codon:yes gene_type:complete